NPRRVIEWALKGLARDAGFGRPSVYETHHNDRFVWDDYVAPLRKPEDSAAAEPVLGDDRVRAYSVRTPLSRVLVGPAEGVIDVRTEIDAGKPNWDTAGIEESARKAVGKLRLPAGAKVRFLFNVKNRDDNTPGRLQALAGRMAAADNL